MKFPSVPLLTATLGVAMIASAAAKQTSLRAKERKLTVPCQGAGSVPSHEAEAAYLLDRTSPDPNYCDYTEQCVPDSCCLGASAWQGRNRCVQLEEFENYAITTSLCVCESDVNRAPETDPPTPVPPAPTPAPIDATEAPVPAPTDATEAPVPAPANATEAPVPAPTNATEAPVPAPTPAPVDPSTPAPVDPPTPAPVDPPTPAPVDPSTPAPVDDEPNRISAGDFDCPSTCTEDCKTTLSAEVAFAQFWNAISHPNEYCEHTGQCNPDACCLGSKNACVTLEDVAEPGEEPKYPGLTSSSCLCLQDA